MHFLFIRDFLRPPAISRPSKIHFLGPVQVLHALREPLHLAAQAAQLLAHRVVPRAAGVAPEPRVVALRGREGAGGEASEAGGAGP